MDLLEQQDPLSALRKRLLEKQIAPRNTSAVVIEDDEMGTRSDDVVMGSAPPAPPSAFADASASAASCRTEARQLLSHWLHCEEEAAEISRKVGVKTHWPAGNVSLRTGTAMRNSPPKSRIGASAGLEEHKDNMAVECDDRDESAWSRISATGGRRPGKSPSRNSASRGPKGATQAVALDDKVLRDVVRAGAADLDADFEEDLAVAAAAISRVNAERRASARTGSVGSSAVGTAPLQTEVDRQLQQANGVEARDDPRAIMEERHRLISEKREQRKRSAVASTFAFFADTRAEPTPEGVLLERARRKCAAAAGSSSSAAGAGRGSRTPAGGSSTAKVFTSGGGAPAAPAAPSRMASGPQAAAPAGEEIEFTEVMMGRRGAPGDMSMKLVSRPPAAPASPPPADAASSCSTYDNSCDESWISSTINQEASIHEQECDLEKARENLRRETSAYKSLLEARQKETRIAVQKAEIEERMERVRQKKAEAEQKKLEQLQKRRDLGCKRIVSSVVFAVGQLSRRSKAVFFSKLLHLHRETDAQLKRFARRRSLEGQRDVFEVWTRYVQLAAAERAEEQWFRSMAKERADEKRAADFWYKRQLLRCVQQWVLFAREAGHLRALDSLKQKTKRFLDLRREAAPAGPTEARNDDGVVGEVTSSSSGRTGGGAAGRNSGSGRSRIGNGATQRKAPSTSARAAAARRTNVDDSVADDGEEANAPGGASACSGSNPYPYAVRYPPRAERLATAVQGATAVSDTSSGRPRPAMGSTSSQQTAEDAGRAGAENEDELQEGGGADHNQSAATATARLPPPPKPRLVAQMEERAALRRARHDELQTKRRAAERQKEMAAAEQKRIEEQRELDAKREKVRLARERKQREEEERLRALEDKAWWRTRLREARTFAEFTAKRKAFGVLQRMQERTAQLSEVAVRFATETCLLGTMEAWHGLAAKSRAARQCAVEALERRAAKFAARTARRIVFEVLKEHVETEKAEGVALHHRLAAKQALLQWECGARAARLTKCAKALEVYKRNLLRQAIPLWREGVEEVQVEKHKERLMQKVKGWLGDMKAV
mmetsp:Transcript_3784/g.9215  ORF Transcript_3784/g.9215 Transcript_3784/m.9215 type:complete len:1064 (+) Transcript_3784:215-3406(+)